MTWKSNLKPAVVLIALLFAPFAKARAEPRTAQRPTFDDVKARTTEFIGWSNSIELTPTQEKTKLQALGEIPAPCCKEYSSATCCCPCNLAKSVWGLANYAVAHLGYDVAQTRALTREWLQATNPAGYSGDACFRGGCERAFSKNGCGGMNEKSVIF